MDTTTTTTTRLERPVEGRVVAGVAEGIARHLRIDPALVRIGFAASSIFGGFGLFLYVVAWLAMPEEGADRPVAARQATTWAVWAVVAVTVLAVVDAIVWGSWLLWR